MGRLVLIFIVALLLPFSVVADSGQIKVKSAHSVKETADRLEVALRSKEMTVFNRIDHAAGARKVGKSLRPTELLIFGNPKSGTPLMQCGQTMGIDLPLKALVWEDATGQVWLSYNDPVYLLQRHAIASCGEVVSKIENALQNFARQAAMP